MITLPRRGRRFLPHALAAVLIASPLAAGIQILEIWAGQGDQASDRPRARSGERLDFRALLQGAGEGQGVRWTAVGAAIDAGGTFIAPQVPVPTTIWVRATSVADASVFREVPVAVRPAHPGLDQMAQLVEACMGPGHFEGFNKKSLPFLNLEAQGKVNRFENKAAVLDLFGSPQGVALPEQRGLQNLVLGCGLQVPLPLAFPGQANVDGLVTIETSEGAKCCDVEDGRAPVVTLTAQPSSGMVEWLAWNAGQNGYESRWQAFSPQVRGVVSLAGMGKAKADALPEAKAGKGVAARFMAPEGLAFLVQYQEPHFAVADAKAHTVRLVRKDGWAGAGAGASGQPGFQDGPLPKARFNGPTHLASGSHQDQVVVADTGNHAIRLMNLDAVTTLAGTGVQGHEDSPGKAQFHTPRGVAMAADGTVYVADSGNRCIRRITRDGVTSTLPSKDVQGNPYAFQDLKGLCLARDPGALLILDGHGVVERTPAGVVLPVAGTQGAPGFRDLRPGQGSPAGPCLRDPYAILPSGNGRYLISDTGNHCVRVLEYAGAQDTLGLTTLAGCPSSPATSWGLFRDRMVGTLPEGFATLEAPRGLAMASKEEHLVSAGGCLMLLSDPKATYTQREGEVERAGSTLRVPMPFRQEGPSLRFTGLHWRLGIPGQDAGPRTVARGYLPAGKDFLGAVAIPKGLAPGPMVLFTTTDEGFSEAFPFDWQGDAVSP